MIGAEGEVLYVGKARSIRKRIAAYTTPERQPARIARMVAQTRSMVFVTTETEAEALLLEANLIKQLKPRYNVVLRDDKSFPYILICTDHPAARLVKHRGARTIEGDYFGPFASAGAVFRTMNALQRAFLLRTCSDSYYAHRTRPCLLYQIKRCSGPCTGEIALDDYAGLVGQARDFLSGRSRAIRQRLADEMTAAAAALEFETAARLRDRISALSAIQGEQSVNPRSIPEADVFAICEEAGQYCVEAFFFRTYQNWGNRAYFPRADRALAAEEVLDAFLAQFYLERPAPRLVLLSHAAPSGGTLCEVLSARAGHRIAIGVPRRGEKKDLVDAAMRNAREALSRKLAEAASQEKLIAALGAAFGVETSDPPGRDLRQFPHHGDERDRRDGGRGAGRLRQEPVPHVQHQERRPHARRRLCDDARGADPPLRPASSARARRRKRAAFPDTPDLVVIDGGRGQFEAAREVMAALGVTGRGARLDRQGAGPQRGPRDLLRRGPRAVPPEPARSGALLRPAAARRGASLRHRNPSRAAQEGVRQESARRNPGHRPGAQARAAARLRLRQGRRPRRPRRPGKDARAERGDGEGGV